MLRLLRWRIVGALPPLPKYVIALAPHTSNWDFVIGVLAMRALGLEASWFAKHTLFRWPFARLLRRLGGVPVVRDAPHDAVAHIVDEFRARDRMVFGLAPEGTRKRVDRWRSGYWHIADEAGVPIVPVAFDYAARRVLIGPPLHTSESMEADEAVLKAFAARATPKRPERYSG